MPKKFSVVGLSAATEPKLVRISLLGPIRIETAKGLIHLPRRKVESLLAYLLLHPEQQTRDHLATLFWGDSPEDKARHSLRTALATLRQHIDEGLLLTDREHVQLNPDFRVWVDLRELLALRRRVDDPDLVTPGRLPALLALWQGDLLSGSYEDWMIAEREHFHARLLHTLLDLTQALRAHSEYTLAIAVAHKVLAFDPANESAHQYLMFCYMAAGERSAALRQYELCEQALLDDLDVPPMAETTALYLWIKQQAGEASSAAARITNLPIPLTSFVGRTQQMTAVKRLLHPATHETRLLTLTGAGGSGKTRLAIQVATDLIDRFAHGVWWVELAALSDGDLVVHAVAKALGVMERSNEPCRQSVINFLQDKQLLLVFDNCEHLIEPAAQLAAVLLSCCPQLQILTTSREALNVAGELLWQVPTFTTPDPAKLSLVNLLLQFESLQLFVARAATVQPDFVLTLANAQAVAEICHRLDGIPLALELAAARIKILSAEQIAAYLQSALGARFDLLTQGSRTVLPRHQTLRATIDWSYNLLDEAERALFRQMAIFAGSFTLEALEQVTGSGANGIPRAPLNLLDLLTQLVDKSLVMVESTAGQRRYRLLETLREYALEQLTMTAELAGLQQRHAAFFLGLAEQAAPELMSIHQHTWLMRLDAEHANLRGALSYLIATADGERALRLATAITRFWEVRGYVSEGREWLHKALAQRRTAAINTQAKALNAAGYLALRQSDFVQAQVLVAESLSLFEQCEEEMGIAEALQNLATAHINQGEYPIAQQRLEHSLTLCRSLKYNYGAARALNLLGNLAIDQDRYTAARDYYQESLHHYQSSGDQVSIATGFFNLGNTARELGDSSAARTNYEACLAISRALGHKGLTGVALRNLGVVAYDQAAYVQARGYAEESLPILRGLGDKVNSGFTLLVLGDVARKLGESSVALAYYCQTLQLLHAVGHKWGMFYKLEAIATLCIEVGIEPASGVRLLAAAHTLRQATSTAVPLVEQAAYAQRLDDLRHQVGEATFATLWDEGQIAPLADIVEAATTLSAA